MLGAADNKKKARQPPAYTVIQNPTRVAEKTHEAVQTGQVQQ